MGKGLPEIDARGEKGMFVQSPVGQCLQQTGCIPQNACSQKGPASQSCPPPHKWNLGGWSHGHPPFQSVGSDHRWLVLAVLWVETILLLPADGKPEGMDSVGKESLKSAGSRKGLGERGPERDPAFRKREEIGFLGGGVFGSRMGAPRACPRPEEMRGFLCLCPFLHRIPLLP